MAEKAKRKKTFEKELPYVEKRINEVLNNYHNPNGSEDRLEICVLRDCNRTIRKGKEEIDRQKAEIERLKIVVKDVNRFIDGLCREQILNGREYEIISFEDLQSYINRAKAEAIRKFAKRLNSKWLDEEIDNLLDETESETNENT